MINDELGKRMKNFYEAIPKIKLIRRTPVAIRIDGKAFHTFTKGFQKPFDEVLRGAMNSTMKYLCENIQGCVLGYCQSDEITLILVDYKNLTSEAWFDYEVQKMCSIAASMATVAFNGFFEENFNNWSSKNIFFAFEKYNTQQNKNLNQAYINAINKKAMFDARCFNIPREEVTNLIYWRQLDAIRNSVLLVGQANFSHKELQNKSCGRIKEMLLERGINWEEYPLDLQRGTCCIKTDTEGWMIDYRIPLFKNEGRNYIEKLINF